MSKLLVVFFVSLLMACSNPRTEGQVAGSRNTSNDLNKVTPKPLFSVGMRSNEVNRAGGTERSFNPYPNRYCYGMESTIYKVENYQFIYCWYNGETNGRIANIRSKSEIEKQIADEQQAEFVQKQKMEIQLNTALGKTGVGFKQDRTFISGQYIAISGVVRNNTSKRIKDIKFSCKYIAKSGTVLTSMLAKSSETIFDKWEPNEVKNISFNIDNIQQVNDVQCSIVNYTN